MATLPGVSVNEARPAIVIAAGGEGTRIGGNKPARKLAGRTLLDHALTWAMANSDEVAIAVRARAQIADSSLPVLIDRLADIGPISALEGAFCFSELRGRDKVMLIGCDLPFLPSSLATRLLQELGANGCAMPTSNRQDHPLAALWRVDTAALADYISGGGRSVRRFAEQMGMVRVDWGDDCSPDPFANINEPAALAEADRRLRLTAD